MSVQRKGPFDAYKIALKGISARTGAPLPSLILSFGILHELTAIVPLVGVFYGARSFGIGERIVDAITQDDLPHPDSDSSASWTRNKLKGWVEEGDRWAGRVGRRYGFFGFEKRAPGVLNDMSDIPGISHNIAGDVANAVVAYGVTKALIPLRIGVSLYLSPVFSRRVVEPVRRTIVQMFRRK